MVVKARECIKSACYVPAKQKLELGEIEIDELQHTRLAMVDESFGVDLDAAHVEFGPHLISPIIPLRNPRWVGIVFDADDVSGKYTRTAMVGGMVLSLPDGTPLVFIHKNYCRFSGGRSVSAGDRFYIMWDNGPNKIFRLI